GPRKAGWTVSRPIGWERLAFRLERVEPPTFLQHLADVLLTLSGARLFHRKRFAGLAQLVGAWRKLPLAGECDGPLDIDIVAGEHMLDRPTVDFRIVSVAFSKTAKQNRGALNRYFLLLLLRRIVPLARG